MSDSLLSRVQRSLGDGYVVQRELGGGGMSHVFLAEEVALGRRVVVKVLPQELAAGVSIDRFRREIGVAVALQHPHIVGVLSAGEADGLPYFVMPYVDGESLRARLQRGRLSIPETVRILRDVARALAFAHDRGIVHRDIKPDNVLLAHGAAAVADFGVAKALSSARTTSGGGGGSGTLTLVGTSLGTPAYMAPEQAAADPNADHRADLYAFGIMAYEMLTGAPPFTGSTPQALLAAQLTEPPPPIVTRRADVPEALTRLVMQCLEKEAARRPQRADDIVTALEDPAVVSGAFVSAPIISGATTAAIPVTPRQRALRLAIIAAGAGAIALAAWLAGRSGAATDGATATPAATAPAAADARSIAVLPLVNIGGDSTDQYFADGMTEELTARLARVRGLRVSSRTAALAARDGEADPGAIAKRLNVATLLEGTVQRSGRRLRITARLVNAADGFMIWSDLFESEEKDLFAVQDGIAGAIVTALEGHFGQDSSAAAPAPIATTADGTNRTGTGDVEAYNLYLRGRFFFEKRGEPNLVRALDYFRQASERDPRFALAYAGTADVYGVLPLYGAARGDSVWPLGLAAADRAVALDSTLADGWSARGSILNALWRWNDAAISLERAIALRPSYASAHQWLGENRIVNGQVADAVRLLGRAAELDPVSPIVSGSYALALGVAGRHDDAIRRAQQAVDLDPGLYVTRAMLGMTLLYAKRWPEATRELEKSWSIAQGDVLIQGLLGYAYAMTGDRAAATEILNAVQRATARDNSASAVARVRMGLGDTAQALTWLERSADRHESFFATETLAAPLWDPLRASARFGVVLRKAGLAIRR